MRPESLHCEKNSGARFPEKGLVINSYTHKLKDLLKLAELKTELEATMQRDPLMERNWAIVQDWSEESRYEKKTVKQTESLLKAIEDQQGGLLPWIRQRW